MADLRHPNAGKWLLGAAVVAFYLLLTAFLTWPLPIRIGGSLSLVPDVLLNVWALGWNYHVLPTDPLGYFDANIFFPRPDTLAYSEHLFGVALVAAPAYLLTGNLVLAYNFALLLSFVLSGIGMYLLAHELTRSRWAALAAGTVYAAAPFRLGHLFHVQILSYQWFPFVFFFLSRFLRDGRPRQIAAATVFAALQILSCNYYAMYLSLALVVFGVVMALVGRSLLDRRKLLLILCGATVLASVSAPFFLPYERNRERGFYRRYEDVVQFSAWPSDYLRPSAFNQVFYAEDLPRQQRSEKALFPGFLALGFAGIGLSGWRRGRDGTDGRVMWIFFSVLVGVAFLLSLGPKLDVGDTSLTLPYRFLYRHVPGFGGMRVPARLAVLVVLGLAGLAGGGLARALGRAGRWRHAIGLAVILVLALEYQTSSLDRILSRAPRIPPVYGWLAAQPGDFGVLELPIHEDITKEAIYMYYSTGHWKDLANGFSGWWPNDYWILVGRMRHFPTSGLLRFLERDVPVRYILVHYDRLEEDRRQKLRRDMYRYRDRLPARARYGSDVVYERLQD